MSFPTRCFPNPTSGMTSCRSVHRRFLRRNTGRRSSGRSGATSYAPAAAGANTSTATAGDTLLDQLLLVQPPLKHRRGGIGRQHIPEPLVERGAPVAVDGQVAQI